MTKLALTAGQAILLQQPFFLFIVWEDGSVSSFAAHQLCDLSKSLPSLDFSFLAYVMSGLGPESLPTSVIPRALGKILVRGAFSSLVLAKCSSVTLALSLPPLTCLRVGCATQGWVIFRGNQAP